MPTIVAFLDVLGFSNYTKEDFGGALGVLTDQQLILSQKLHRPNTPNCTIASTDGLNALGESNPVDSFQHFLPFSDSTFIISTEPGKFIRQLARFLTACFERHSNAFSQPECAASPETVTVQEWAGLNKTYQEKWYPGLWRGGLATGEAHITVATAIVNGKGINMTNVTGSAVGDAVRFEKAGRGPRLFCSNDLKDSFGPDLRPFFQNLPNTDSASELLWPGLLFSTENPLVEMNEFDRLWRPAVGLWKSKRQHEAAEQYDEFLRLLVRSFMCWAKVVQLAGKGRTFVRKRIRIDLGDALVDGYLS